MIARAALLALPGARAPSVAGDAVAASGAVASGAAAGGAVASGAAAGGAVASGAAAGGLDDAFARALADVAAPKLAPRAAGPRSVAAPIARAALDDHATAKVPHVAPATRDPSASPADDEREPDEAPSPSGAVTLAIAAQTPMPFVAPRALVLSLATDAGDALEPVAPMLPLGGPSVLPSAPLDAAAITSSASAPLDAAATTKAADSARGAIAIDLAPEPSSPAPPPGPAVAPALTHPRAPSPTASLASAPPLAPTPAPASPPAPAPSPALAPAPAPSPRPSPALAPRARLATPPAHDEARLHANDTPADPVATDSAPTVAPPPDTVNAMARVSDLPHVDGRSRRSDAEPSGSTVADERATRVDARRANDAARVLSGVHQVTIRRAAHGEIELPELGRVAVVARSRAADVDVEVRAARADVASDLSARAGEVNADLRAAGISLASLRIEVGAPAHEPPRAGDDPGAAAGDPRDRAPGGSPRRDDAPPSPTDAPAPRGRRARIVL